MAASSELVHLRGGYVAVRQDAERGRIVISAEASSSGTPIQSSVRMDLGVVEARKLAGLLTEAAMLVAGVERGEASRGH